ncbi:MAG: thioredoxin family protein [Spirochaetales bacterium]|nr:thioredoxin family protein [Spirochaetales bacterium]
MKRFTFFTMILIILTTGVFSLAAAETYPPEGWVTDINQAMKIAQEEEKLILVNFTGSDWCGWCMKLKDEVFTKSAWQEFAKENMVMLFLDFPSGITLSENQQVHNGTLAQVLGVRGYPTLIVLESDLTPRLQTGYTGMGPSEYAAHVANDINITPDSAAAVGAELNRVVKLLPKL